VPNLPDAVAHEAYSHEVSSAGFWPGGGAIDYPAFYSYAYPEPAGFRTTKVKPDAAFFSEALGEFILPYDAVRTALDPDKALLDFLQGTYEGGDLGEMGSRCAGMRAGPARRSAAGLVLQLRLGHRLPDFRAAVGAFIGEVDLRHAPMRFDIPHIHRKPDAAWTNDKGWLDVVVMVDIGWHVDTPHESIHQ